MGHTLSTGASTIIFTLGASVKQTGQELQVQKVAYNSIKREMKLQMCDGKLCKT